MANRQRSRLFTHVCIGVGKDHFALQHNRSRRFHGHLFCAVDFSNVAAAITTTVYIIKILMSVCSDFYGSCERDAARICCWAPCCWVPLLLGASHAAINRYLLPAGPTAANLPHTAAAVDSWDRQMDRQPDRRTDTVPLHRPCRILCESVSNSINYSVP